MTDYERRMELLNQTKHARVANADIVSDEDTDKPKSTFGLRVTICIVCFICYVLFDYGNMKVMNVNSKVVTNQIKTEMQIPKFDFTSMF